MAAADIGSAVFFAATSATVPSGEESSNIASCRALNLGTGVAAGGPVITIAAGGPTGTATLPTAVTSSAVGNSEDYCGALANALRIIPMARPSNSFSLADDVVD
jgi:hypothetical protein